MFSQFLNVVENRTQPAPNKSEAQSLSSSQLADSALANLRKSFASQRPGSPGPAPGKPPPNSKLNLEERLRAKFAIGDASNSTTPNASGRASPTSASGKRPTSPSSTPLPESPILSPGTASGEESILTTDALAGSHPLESHQPNSSVVPPDATTEDAELHSTPDDRHPEAEVPLPPGDDSLDLEEIPKQERSNFDDSSASVEALQARLKLVEKRFTDVSVSFKKLQAERTAVDAVVREWTPLGGVSDVDGLHAHFANSAQQSEISQDEIHRLLGKLSRQDERMEELRDTHRLESNSQSDQIEGLRRQMRETDALLKASQLALSNSEEESSRRQAAVTQLLVEVEKSKSLAKEEEEKRVKAISLLKTVRQKLVKTEKEKEEAVKEALALRERERDEREKERVERARLQSEIDTGNLEREKAITGLKAQFDREVNNFKDRSEKEISALRSQFELEIVSLKNTHSKDLAAKNSQISSLENSVNNLAKDKSTFFEQLQLRQAELESSQSHLESLQSQNTELQYQMREANDQISLLQEELAEAQRDHEIRHRGPSTSPEELARLISATEVKYQARIADLAKNLTIVEKEHNESEGEWSRKLREKSRELEDLRKVLDSSSKSRQDNEEVVNALKKEIGNLKEENRLCKKQLSDLHLYSEKLKDSESAAEAQQSDLQAQIKQLELQIEENKTSEAQLRATNKTLREELRKVQSSAALLERQRNPGVGYWTSRPENGAAEQRSSTPVSSSGFRMISPPSSPAPSQNEEEVNLEYLRNVILQFLEHKEMRPNLVRVLSVILRFTPQETRRLIAKV